MATFNYKEAENYGGSGGSGFFSLRDDGDKATVRFLYNDVKDVNCHSTHEVYINNKKRYVDCLRESHQPVDDCPFCKAGKPVIVKLIIPVYDERDDSVKIWDRGKGFISQMTSLCSTYGEDGPIVAQKFTVVRSGQAGSKETRYNVYPTRDAIDDTTLEDFDMPDICGPKGFILKKTFDEMEMFLDTGHFPTDSDSEPVRRNSSRDNNEDRPVRRGESHRTGRRTPSDTF